MYLFERHGCATICIPGAEECVRLAAEDLRGDVQKAGGPLLPMGRELDVPGPRIVIGALTSPAIARFARARRLDVSGVAGKWEHYLLQTLDADTLAILGSDARGTMWGIYQVCQRFLGVDPLYWWTGHPVEKREAVEIPPLRAIDGPTGYRFRGWFINDEDLLSGLCLPEGEKNGRMQSGYPPVLARIVETALRLRQNLLIPCSFLDIDLPEDEALVNLVTRRGLFISMHHQEPVGVHHRTVDRWWKARGVDEVNYVDDPEKFKEVWAHYIEKWAKHKNVIWQLGLRGRGDRPVWYGSSRIPDTMEARGALISDAVEKQLALIRRACGTDQVFSTTTLWMEGMPLYAAGALRFPRETMIVLSDFGPDQTWPEGYDCLPRWEGRDYGVYYHLAFWGCGPHLVPGNRLEKVQFNYLRAIRAGDTAYSIVNVANVREFVCGIQYIARLTWNLADNDPGQAMQDWCSRQFGPMCAGEVAQWHQRYFQAFAEMDSTRFPRRMVLMDGMCRRVAMQLMDIIAGGELRQPDIQNKRLFAFASTDAFIERYRASTETGIVRFVEVLRQAQALEARIPADRRQFFRDQAVMPAGVMLHLYRWVHALCLAAENRRCGGDGESYLATVEAAEEAMRQASLARQSCAHGPWARWYALDPLSDFAGAQERTARLKELATGEKGE